VGRSGDGEENGEVAGIGGGAVYGLSEAGSENKGSKRGTAARKGSDEPSRAGQKHRGVREGAQFGVAGRGRLAQAGSGGRA
jgi:hypothetical protein